MRAAKACPAARIKYVQVVARIVEKFFETMPDYLRGTVTEAFQAPIELGGEAVECCSHIVIGSTCRCLIVIECRP